MNGGKKLYFRENERVLKSKEKVFKEEEGKQCM